MSRHIDKGDKAAVILSVLCTFHCIASPLILIAVPSISTLLAFDPEALHFWLLFAVIPISSFAMISGYLHHRQPFISVMSVTGMVLLVAAVLFGHDLVILDSLSGKGEAILTVLGSLFIAYGHIKSLYARRGSSQFTALAR